MHFCDYEKEGCYLMENQKQKPIEKVKQSLITVLINSIFSLFRNRKQKVKDVIIDELEKEGEKILNEVIEK